MGKSNKKFKAERINAIRKQYDSFIEEDKKRKDRNEYILERLDKIRTSSALVQVRKDYFPTLNPNQFLYDRNDYIEKNRPTYENRYGFKPVNHSNVITSFNESEMLKEISKKFILIPRHKSTLEYNDNYLVKSNPDDNGDWRKKYSILEELKQNEKEEKQKIDSDICKDFTTININEKELNNIKIEEPSVQTQLILSEHSAEKLQDNSAIISSFDQANANTEIDRLLQKPEIEENVTDTSENIANSNEPVSNETDNLTHTVIDEQPISQETTLQENPIKDQHFSIIDDLVNEHHAVKTDLNIDDLTQKEIIQSEYEVAIKPKEDVQFEKVQISNIDAERDFTEISQAENYEQDKVKHVHDEIQQDTNILNDSCPEEKLSPSHEPLPVENINFIVPNADEEIGNIDNEIVDNQIDPHEVSPIVYPSEENFVNTGNDDQIEEFEAEQTEMFYSDPKVLEHAYEQTGAANVDYEDNKDYTHDESYAYYDNVPEEQVYTGQMNDHQETIEQYDPNYESQYTNYEHRDQLLEEQYGHYTAEETAPQPQAYDQVQFDEPDYNIVKEVEGELDAEQNYITVPTSQEDNIANILDDAILPEGDSIDEIPVPPTPVS